MKINREEVGIRIEGTWTKLGEFDFSEFETIEECVAKFGEDVALSLINRSWSGDLQRTARENCKKTGEAAKTTEEIQKLIDDFRPGVRAFKFNLKNYNDLMTKVAESGKFDILSTGCAIYRAEGPEAAFNYFMENK